MPTLNITIPDASDTVKGIQENATQTEVNTGTATDKTVTPETLQNSDLRGEVTANTAKVGITPTQASDIVANNSKVTNATHTGEVTGSGALTVEPTAISNKPVATLTGTEEVLVNSSGTLEKTTTQDIADLGGGGGSKVAISYGNWAGGPLVDGTTYKIAQQVSLTTGANGFARIPIPAGTVNEVHISGYNGSTFGSSENITVRLLTDNGSSDDTLSSNVLMDDRHYYEKITSLGLTIVDGLSWVEVDIPTMVTNPVSGQFRITIIIEL